MQTLEALIDRLEGHIADHELIRASVSKAPVGWHIEHSLLTLDVVIEALSRSRPEEYKRTFDIRRSVVILFGKIPRGRIKAPRAVRPAETFNKDSLYHHLSVTRANLAVLARLGPGHFFKHPFLGDFKVKPAVRFLTVHTRHHLAIIQDIVNHKN